MLKDIKNWKRIPTETYKNILIEAKERYVEMMSQSASISTKIDKMIVINAAVLLWLSTSVVSHKEKISHCIYLPLIVYILFLFWSLVETFFGRKCTLIGSYPSDILGNENELSGKDVDGDYNEKEKEKVYYYYLCFRYNNRIESFQPILNKRAGQLKKCLILTFVTFSISLSIFVFTNF